MKITALARCPAGNENHTVRTVPTSCGQPTDSASTGLIFWVQPTSPAGSTGSTSGTASEVVTAVASSSLRSRPARAASQPSMATAPAARR